MTGEDERADGREGEGVGGRAGGRATGRAGKGNIYLLLLVSI